MGRIYKPKVGTKPYRKYTASEFEGPFAQIDKGTPVREASRRFKIPLSVLRRHNEARKKNKSLSKQGGQTVLTTVEEELIVERLITCGVWGYPLDSYDLRLFVKGYLDRIGRTEKRFKDNMPGKEFAWSFLERHKDSLAQRICQNIKRARAMVSVETINGYFEHLGETIKDVPVENILNYDETNLSDDPGRKLIIVKRGTKYPERVMNSTKQSVSVMFAGSGSGVILPPYVVYKSKELYNTWIENGPRGTRYNRSKSGWFDSICFEDWLRTIAVPYLKKLPGKKILIGDNLSSHLSMESVQLCTSHDISLVFLPSNSTHLTQPLDVAFFHPMKQKWREILQKWKCGAGRKETSVPKSVFPRLLRELMEAIEFKGPENLKAGFEKCGIVPLNATKVLERLPPPPPPISNPNDSTRTDTNQTMDNTLTEMLKELRYGEEQEKRQRKKKVNVPAGRSVNTEDFMEDENAESDSDNEVVDDPTPVDQVESIVSSVNDQGRTSEVIFRGKKFPNVFPITDDLQTGDWILVAFDPDCASSSNKTLNYVGKVLEFDKGLFNVSFLRPKQSRDHNGHIFGHPDVEDEAWISHDSIIGKLIRPERFGRGLYKFEIHKNQII